MAENHIGPVHDLAHLLEQTLSDLPIEIEDHLQLLIPTTLATDEDPQEVQDIEEIEHHQEILEAGEEDQGLLQEQEV